MEQQPVALRRGLAPEQRPVQEAEILPSLGVLVRIVEGDLGACDLPAVQRSGKAVLSQQAFALAFPAGQDRQRSNSSPERAPLPVRAASANGAQTPSRVRAAVTALLYPFTWPRSQRK